MKDYKEIDGLGHFEGVYDEALVKFNSGVFVCVGVWVGRNEAYLGQRIKELNKDIKVYAVDTFWGTQNEEDKIRDLVIERYSGDMYPYFIQNMIDCGVDDVVTPLKMTSIEASKQFEDNSIEFCFLDGDHSYESIKADIEAWLPKVKHGGVIAGDDYAHFSHTVGKAVNDLLPGSGRSWWWWSEKK